MQLPEIDFSSLELREIGDWPWPLRVIIILFACVLAIVGVYFFVLSSEFAVLETQKVQLESKRKDFKDKYTMAVNLDAYKQQLVEMQNTYKELLKELPATSDIPDLIDNISKIGDSNGIKFSSIKIGDAQASSGFYMELPISFALTGTYHNFGKFINDISRLPRIVTLGDFSIRPMDIADKETVIPGNLMMNLDAKTYWLESASEQQQSADKNKPGAASGNPSATPSSTPGMPPVASPANKPATPPSSNDKANANKRSLEEQGG